MKKVFVGAVIFWMVYSAYSAIVSLPDAHINQAKNLLKTLERDKKSIEVYAKRFESLKSSKDWPFYEPYAKRENWPSSFSAAQVKINKAAVQYENDITPILDRNHKDDLAALTKHVDAVRSLMLMSLNDAKAPNQRAATLMDSFTNKNKYYLHAGELTKTAIVNVDAFEKRGLELAKKYPVKASSIQKKTQDIKALLAEISASNVIVKTQYKASSTDYAIFSDNYQKLKKQDTQFNDFRTARLAEINQLDRTYVKILSDQKIDYFLEVGRASWCESDGCYNGDTTLYPMKRVDANTFEYFDSTNISTIGKFTYWKGFKSYVPKTRWNALSVDPNYRFNSGHSVAEYWINGSAIKTAQKYTIIEDGEITETDWQSVSNAVYWQEYNNLGMAIATKLIGQYESDTKKTAEPVGLAMVADPEMINGKPHGSNQYGEWQTNSSGQSFWHYYGMYRMVGDFIDGPSYRYNDWNSYRSRARSKPYYGKTNKEYGTFGTNKGARKSFNSSSFVKRNPSVYSKGATLRRGNNSIRGAGAANRGRGPSGSGK